MHKKQSLVSAALFFLILSFFLLFLSQVGLITPVTDFFGGIFSPIEKITYDVVHRDTSSSELMRLRDENGQLRKQLVQEKTIQSENNALRDQFQTTIPKSQSLLPALILGAPGFPEPQYLVVDKGSTDGVITGEAIVVKDNVVGIVSVVSAHRSKISLLKEVSAITAKTLDTNALGIVKANNSGELIFGNVLMSDTIKKDDVVVSRGDINKNGKGFIPHLVIGKVVAIDKKPSALFQSARIKSLVDVKKLEMVFILVNP